MTSDKPDVQKKYKNWNDRWKWIVSIMVYQDLFVHEFLFTMKKIATSEISTMGVAIKDSKLILLYNLEFINKLNDHELRFVITHEVYHVVFHHCTTRQPSDPSERGLWNKAADMAINGIIPQSHLCYMPKNYKGVEAKDFGFEEKLSMEQYIQLLREKEDNGQGEKGAYGTEKEGELGGGIDNHDNWSENNMIKELVKEKVRQLSKRENVWGSLPGDLQGMIMSAQSSEVNWQRYLKHYLGSIVSSIRQPTFKRPNKRYGYPFCGKKRKYVDRNLVSFDTSGSVSDSALSIFLGEVNRLVDIMPVDIVLFDSTIQLGPVPFERRQVRFNFKGRGGTSFNPVFKLAEDQRYHSLIILTDGQAPCPPPTMYVKNVIWVITGEYNDKPEGAPGVVVKIREKS